MRKCKDILVKLADWSESKTARAFWLGTVFRLLSASIEYVCMEVWTILTFNK